MELYGEKKIRRAKSYNEALLRTMVSLFSGQQYHKKELYLERQCVSPKKGILQENKQGKQILSS